MNTAKNRTGIHAHPAFSSVLFSRAFQHGFCCFHIVCRILHSFYFQRECFSRFVHKNCCRQTIQVVNNPVCKILVRQYRAKRHTSLLICFRSNTFRLLIGRINDNLHKIHIRMFFPQLLIKCFQRIQFVDIRIAVGRPEIHDRQIVIVEYRAGDVFAFQRCRNKIQILPVFLRGCLCGSFIRRMVPRGGRLRDRGRLWALDGVLLDCPGVVDYALEEDGSSLTLLGVRPPELEEAHRRLKQAGIEPVSLTSRAITGFSGTGMQKRTLSERSD